MSRTLAVLLFLSSFVGSIALTASGLPGLGSPEAPVTASAAADPPPPCTIPATGDACPSRQANGDCKAGLEWFADQETACAGVAHAAIAIDPGKKLIIDATPGTKFKVLKFKRYPVATCGKGNPHTYAKPFSVAQGGYQNKHTLTAKSNDVAYCYEVNFRRADGSVVDPHIVIPGRSIQKR